MGLDIKESFAIDAAKLLAKLHRGACETHKDSVFFNSGVLNDEEIRPDQCENSKISFDMTLARCELGVVALPEVQCKLKHTADDILDKMTKDEKEESEKAKITDNPDQKANESDIPSFMSFMREDDKKGDGRQEGSGDVLVDPFVEPKDATDEVKKMVKENQDALEKEISNAVRISVAYLQDYMKEFAGEAESKKITDKAIARVYLPDGADPAEFEYRDDAIEGLSDEDRQKAWHEVLKKDSGTAVYVVKNLCCKVAYNLSMEG